jgi:NAD(P)-dependent dehydrogenase (short-subunit alcohol dehydrogenase family)
MTTAEPSELLRPGLLEDVSLLLAGVPASAAESASSLLGGTVAEICSELGARVVHCRTISDESEPIAEAELDAQVASAVEQAGRIDLLAVDGAALFDRGFARGGDGHAALRTCMDAAWNVTRATVNQAFLQVPESRGRVIFLAPSPAAGEHAAAACAGLENLARTLSIEWARYQITTVAIAPGVRTSAEEVAALVAYLASPAGAYFSGCLLDLRGALPDLRGA